MEKIMIIDKLENISLYSQIPDSVCEFLKTLSEDTLCGRYNLSETDYVNIETYSTKLISEGKFETHDNYIDIQLLLSGQERIYIDTREGLKEENPYNLEKDITFYVNDISGSDFVTLNGSNFVMIYPHEAHAPQISNNNLPQCVKKAVFKIKV